MRGAMPEESKQLAQVACPDFSSAPASGSAPPQASEPSRKLRGFATLTPDQRRKIAQLGGLTSQEIGAGHRFTDEEAREGGRKGGVAISGDREHMARIGRIGGQRRWAARSAAPSS